MREVRLVASFPPPPLLTSLSMKVLQKIILDNIIVEGSCNRPIGINKIPRRFPLGFALRRSFYECEPLQTACPTAMGENSVNNEKHFSRSTWHRIGSRGYRLRYGAWLSAIICRVHHMHYGVDIDVLRKLQPDCFLAN